MKTEPTIHDILLEAITSTSSYNEWIAHLKNLDRDSGPAITVQELISVYEDIPQGLKWHPEFEVSKHVYLLCVSLHRQGRDDLLETAFLHDIGKIYCTNVGDDRIYSYGHAQVSVPYVDALQEFLKYYELTRSVTKRHMDYHKMSDPRIKNDLHMKEFVKADKKMSTVLFYEFFADEAEENKRKEAEVYREQRESDKTVYIAVGISGSGKSTYLHKHFRDEVIVCPDEIRRKLCGDISDQSKNEEVWNEARCDLLATLHEYGEAVLDATNVNKYRRVCFMSEFNGVRKVALVFPVELEEAIGRVKKDIAEGVDRSNVPVRVIKRQNKNFNRGLKSLVHEFNEVRVIAEVDNGGITLEVVEKIDEAIKEKNNE